MPFFNLKILAAITAIVAPITFWDFSLKLFGYCLQLLSRLNLLCRILKTLACACADNARVNSE